MSDGNDFALSRVTPGAKRPMWEMLVILIGSLACVSQLMLGAALGYGMSFRDAIIATMIASTILWVVSWAIGAAAAKEGLSTSLLSRWAGFGKLGSSILGGVIAISLIGWFGVQNSVFADGLATMTGVLNEPIWALITGIGLTVVVVFGIKAISKLANIFVPLFIVAVGIAAVIMFQRYPVSGLFALDHPGPALGLGAGVTMIAGGFMIGAVTTPDFSRFLNGSKDVFWMTLIGTFVGELGMNLIAVLLAHATGTENVVDIMMTLTGWLGAAIVVFSTVKLNDANLYSSSLGLSTTINALFNRDVSRATLTWILGVTGTVLSMIGIMDYFSEFLTILGVAIPPVGGIIIVDYYILRRDRAVLDASRERDELPADVDLINPVSIVVWFIAFLVGQFTTIGIPALTSLFCAGLLYWIVMVVWGKVAGSGQVRFRRTTNVAGDVEYEEEHNAVARSN